MTRRRSGARVILLLGSCLILLVGCFGPIERPVADFTWCPDGTEGRLDYWFTSMSTAPAGASIELLRWEFGDETPAVETYWDVVHRFVEERVHSVTLTVTDSRGVSGYVTKDVVVEMAAFVHSNWLLTLGYPPTVSGIVENRYTERLDEVTVRAKFYDADGVRLTDGRFVVRDLDPGEKATFAVRAEEFASYIFHATVDVESFVAECGPSWVVVPAADGD